MFTLTFTHDIQNESIKPLCLYQTKNAFSYLFPFMFLVLFVFQFQYRLDKHLMLTKCRQRAVQIAFNHLGGGRTQFFQNNGLKLLDVYALMVII